MLPRRAYISRSSFDRKPPERGSRKWLIAELDRLTSLIVRRRDRRCVTCGSRRNLQCSHFYSRRYLTIRFNLINCNAMCSDCNRRHNVDPFPYIRFLEKWYGEDAIPQLHELRMKPVRITDEELARTLDRYKRMA